jgi:hypothetical protein
MRTVLFMLILVGTSNVASGQAFRLNDEDGWSPLPEPAAGSAEEGLRNARRAIAREAWDQSETICRDWLTRFTSTARIRPLLGDQDVPVVEVEQAQSPLVGEVRLLLGDALRARGELYPAAVEYETVARSYPDSPAWLDAVERCYEIAVIWSKQEPEFLMGIFPVSDWTEEVEELLIRVQERVPGSILAERAGFALMEFYFREENYRLTADMAAIVLENHPTTPQADLARRRIVDANRRLWKGPENDLSGLEEASSILSYFIAEDPVAAQRINSAQQLREVQEDLVQSEWSTAQWYLRSGDPVSAAYEVSRLADRYADTALWPKIKAWATEKVRPLIPIPLRSLVDELP